VVFRPQAVQDEKAQVTLVDKSGTQSDAVTLSGRGTGAPNAPPPPPPPWHHVAFETRLVEVPAGVKVPVSVRNTGEDVATIGSITVDDGKTFNVDQTPCQAKQRLMPGDACEVIVTSNDRTIHVSKLQLVNADKRVEDVASIVNFMFPNRRVEVVNPILQQLQKKGEVRIQPPAKATKIQ
jgi:hypothetical protein